MTKVAIVTGGASGIGRAIAAELVHRGATVVIADINAEAAELTTKQLNASVNQRDAGADRAGAASAVELDVTDAGAVLAAYQAVAAEHGRLDLVFNNAGIAVGGLAEEFTLEHWDRTIDVNLRGVVHGIHAAYPIMLEQGYGHMLNTASLAGLVHAALMTPYTATKSAVIGLSLALRAEAAGRGVRVSVLCPGFVDTPLLERINTGLPPTGVNDETRMAGGIQPPHYAAEKLAKDVMRGLARNRAVIVAPGSARFAALLVRHFPAAGQSLNRWLATRYLGNS